MKSSFFCQPQHCPTISQGLPQTIEIMLLKASPKSPPTPNQANPRPFSEIQNLAAISGRFFHLESVVVLAPLANFAGFQSCSFMHFLPSYVIGYLGICSVLTWNPHCSDQSVLARILISFWLVGCLETSLSKFCLQISFAQIWQCRIHFWKRETTPKMRV